MHISAAPFVRLKVMNCSRPKVVVPLLSGSDPVAKVPITVSSWLTISCIGLLLTTKSLQGCRDNLEEGRSWVTLKKEDIAFFLHAMLCNNSLEFHRP